MTEQLSLKDACDQFLEYARLTNSLTEHRVIAKREIKPHVDHFAQWIVSHWAPQVKTRLGESDTFKVVGARIPGTNHDVAVQLHKLNFEHLFVVVFTSYYEPWMIYQIPVEVIEQKSKVRTNGWTFKLSAGLLVDPRVKDLTKEVLESIP